jgi:hypothetical protein
MAVNIPMRQSFMSRQHNAQMVNTLDTSYTEHRLGIGARKFDRILSRSARESTDDGLTTPIARMISRR